MWFLTLVFVVLLQMPSKAQEPVEVGGLITQDAVWTPDFTYIVVENIRVISGVRLHIQAGTTVKINQGRGITIENGQLHITGTATDSVRLVANRAENESWNWSGITISSIEGEGNVKIEYTHLSDALVGIKAIASDHLLIQNNQIIENRNLGISLTNSSECIIRNNIILHNFQGIEIYASDPGNVSANNQILANKIENTTTNIIIHNNNHGSCPENMIDGNLIQRGIHGVWLFNNSNGGSGHATVQNNFIINNGTANDGYGIYVSMDSTIVQNNILWQNTTAVAFTEATKCHFLYNSLTANRNAIKIRNGSQLITVLNNTLTLNTSQIVQLSETEDFVFGRNNVFGNLPEEAAFVNQGANGLSIPENFWNTNDTAYLNKLIFDQNDNPSIGLVSYLPVLSEANTDAPMAPPIILKSQLVNGQTLLSWSKSPESDLLGYRLYYGTFNDYRFSDSTNLVSDTTFTLQGNLLNSQVAITSLDQEGNSIQAQVLGHQSPFSFATAYPYAGKDSTICSTETEFLLAESTVPIQYDSIVWKSSGDGQFSNVNQLRPVYSPGNSDIDQESVVLTLELWKNNQRRVDDMLLRIKKPPFVFAGNDVLISPDSLFTASEALLLQSEDLLWESLGDGSFDDVHKLKATYFPGEADIQNELVTLVLHALTTSCGTTSDTLQLLIRPAFSVQGFVSAHGMRQANVPVLALRINQDERIPASTLSTTETDGSFRFDKLFAATYVFYAIPDTFAGQQLLPTYHVKSERWQQAYEHRLLGDIYDLDIQLANCETSLPEGIGSITGFFGSPAFGAQDFDVYCQPWFGDDSAINYCSTGLSNATILLFSQSRDRVYRFALTDAEGKFSFGQLPYGNYLLEAELAGYTSSFSQIIRLSPDVPIVNDVSLQMAPDNKITISVPAQPTVYQTFRVYPNPTSRFVMVSDLDRMNDQQVTIYAYDVYGRLYFERIQTVQSHSLRIDLQSLPGGLYQMLIKSPSQQFSFPLIKQPERQ